MASIININGEVDLEQGHVESGIEDLKMDGGRKREPIIAEHNDAVVALEKFSCYMAIISVFFIFGVTKGFINSDKERTQTAFTIFLVAITVSILVGMVSTFGRALHRWRVGPALPIKRVVLIANVLLCISEGFFMVSVFAAIYTLVPLQLVWDAFCMRLGLLVVKIAFSALLYAVFELRPGFVGMAVLTFFAIVFCLSGLFVVAHFALLASP